VRKTRRSPTGKLASWFTSLSAVLPRSLSCAVRGFAYWQNLEAAGTPLFMGPPPPTLESSHVVLPNPMPFVFVYPVSVATTGCSERRRCALALIDTCPLSVAGRFLIRLSDSLFLAPQSDLEKKGAKCRSKWPGKKRPNPGCFWFTAVGGRFFRRRKDFRVGPSLGSEWQKNGAHGADTLCLQWAILFEWDAAP
jgi:hypothetical protein